MSNTRVEVTDPETGEVFGLNASMLVSDIRDVLISKRRNQIAATTWSTLSEDQQRDEIVAATELAEDLVIKAVELIAQFGREVIHAKLDNFKIKDGMVTLTAKGLADDEALLALNHVGSKALKIIVADAEQHDQQREGLEPDPDQPDMDLDGEHVENSEEDLAQPEPMDEPEPEGEFSDDDFEDDGGAPDDPADAGAYDIGLAARADGSLMKDNPFDKGTPEFDEWKRGWKENADNSPKSEPEIDPADAGRAARMGGVGPDENPFDGGTDEHAAWAESWQKTESDIQGVIQSGRDSFAAGEDRDSRGGWKEGSDAAGFWFQGFDEAADAAGTAEPDTAPAVAESADQSENPDPGADQGETVEEPADQEEKPGVGDSASAGAAAYKNGQPIEDNPFSLETDKIKHRIWARGWNEAAEADVDTGDDAA